MNQLTLPEYIFQNLTKSECFDVTVENGRIILTPVHSEKMHTIREKIEGLSIGEQDIADAVDWARNNA